MWLNVAPPLKRWDGVDNGRDWHGESASRTAMHLATSARQAPAVKLTHAGAIRWLLKDQSTVEAAAGAL